MATGTIAKPLGFSADEETGLPKLLMAILVTQLACGALVLALHGTHPLADATTFISFLKDWALISRFILNDEPLPQLTPVFDPALLNAQAAGGINVDQPDADIIRRAMSLPMHRYDWWASAATCPWPFQIPTPFKSKELTRTGKVMPWAEWDLAVPVSNYVVHLNRSQIDHLWNKATKNASQKLSRHDAVLGHIWSCIARARGLAEDNGPIHCDLVYGVRPSFRLGEKFLGSPVTMMNVELSGFDEANPSNLRAVATNGNVLIKEAPPVGKTSGESSYWTDNGVDVSIHIRTEDTQRLAKDPSLFPSDV
ncbi:hypothetical protein EDB80DRAFT_690984 [Ilyonectria destructans]|nr:hypothetical protein EDB80DRAFT_872877 [Ilyonectria destructans]KAH6985363.1 hypothetical protein EDB80DRAFT_690984 [Ilyonectria destructans]